jgi:signal transduction histidine kinase/CheY-like chemotaxis protein/HPt (histidine-containing phosphotransfer) domain-containing protein
MRTPVLVWLAWLAALAAAVCLALQLSGSPAPLPWTQLALGCAAFAALLGIPAAIAAGRAHEAQAYARERLGRVQNERDRLQASLQQQQQAQPPQPSSQLLAQLQQQQQRLRELEAELQQTKQAAESAVLAKGEFLATMSHEIRTPLNGIIPMLDMLAGAPLSADQRGMLDTAAASSRQLLRIVDDILDYSRLEAEKLDLETTAFNLRETLDGVLRLMQRPAENKGLKLELQLDPAVRLPVRGDPLRLRQVLGNLIGNAIKFTAHGGVTVAVLRLGETAGQHRLRFEVRDTGIGIDSDTQARLFQPFTQADASTTRLFGGSGLGLAICKRIVDLMGGRIGVDSVRGQGATFWFEVPLLKALGDLAAGAPPQRVRNVLLVSPDLRLRERLQHLLPGWGLHVHGVDTVPEALERLRNGDFAWVVADLSGMPSSARALHRGLRFIPAHNLRTLWLFGDEPLPEELRESGTLLSRHASESDLRAALSAQEPAETAAAPADETETETAVAFVVAGDDAPLLLVEDNPVNLAVAEKLLASLDLHCEHAGNGEVALEMMASGRYRLVLMDCQMPVLDGYAATRRWREHEAQANGPRLPIVAMTANAMAGDRQRCLDAGMDDYLTKPISREQLAACLQRWLSTGSRIAAPLSDATVEGDAGPATGSGLPVLDAEALDELRSIAGEETLRIVRLFLEDAPRLIARIEQAAAATDLDAMGEAAHTLKSSSANLGALALSAAAKRIEQAARSGTLDRPGAVAALVVAEYARARIALLGYSAQLTREATEAG